MASPIRRSLKTLLMAAACALASPALVQAQTAPAAAAPAAPKRNVIIFVADGLRYGIVNKDTAPVLADIQKNGVDFQNSHSLYPTVTTTNASAIATGHGIGDTGEWSNSLYLPTPAPSVVGMENNAVLNDVNGRYGGNYFNETSLLAMARANGYQTAAIGKEGPILIQDITAAGGTSTIVIDDSTGAATGGRGVPLDPAVRDAITAAGLSLNPDDHKSNGSMYSSSTTGLKVNNAIQQHWMTDVATKVVLPRFVAADKPFALIYWSRDPDGTQHNTGDGINQLTPGINGPTGLSGVANASENLGRLIETLKALGIYDNTDIFVTADHGFSTVLRQSATSYSTRFTYPDVMVQGYLPEGFPAIDLAHDLGLKLNGNSGPLDPARGEHPRGVAFLGDDRAHPDAVMIGSGGSELIYLDAAKAKDLAPKIVASLTRQDYVAAVFVDDGLGPVAGALPMSQVGLMGDALTPRPAIYVSFRDFTTPACLQQWKNPELCSVMVSDTGLQQGQGNHGALSRANTRNFMAAIGPDFKKGYADLAPISNADIAPTLAHILGFTATPNGALTGRVITEALKDGPATTKATPHVVRSKPAANGFVTVLENQTVGKETYFDAAGMPGRVVGLKTKK
jgi:arylsulfatase A-like enzyme